MKNLKYKLITGLCGASGGLMGLLSFSRCYGSGCSSCFGCVGSGVGIFLLLLLNKSGRK